MRANYRLICHITMALLLVSLTGCIGFKPAALVVSPENAEVKLENTVIISAYGVDAKGSSKQLSGVKWAIVEGVGELSAEKGDHVILKAIKPSDIKVEASYGRLKAYSTLHVVYEQVLTLLEIDPAAYSMNEGSSKDFLAKGFDQYGNLMEVAPYWSVEGRDGELLTGQGGNVSFRANKYGNYTLSAMVGSMTAEASVMVSYSPVISRIIVNIAEELGNIESEDGKYYIRAGTVFTAWTIGFDQYGEKMEPEIIWSVEGNGCEIETTSKDAISVRANSTGEHKLIAKQGGIETVIPFKVFRWKLPFWPHYL